MRAMLGTTGMCIVLCMAMCKYTVCSFCVYGVCMIVTYRDTSSCVVWGTRALGAYCIMPGVCIMPGAYCIMPEPGLMVAVLPGC